MTPTYHEREALRITTYRKIQRFDVVVFQLPGEKEPYLKRVIGLPGETVHYQKGQLYINNKKVTDYYAKETKDYPVSGEKIKLSSNQYFILGDNRKNSKDSREFGPITKQMMKGIVKGGRP